MPISEDFFEQRKQDRHMAKTFQQNMGISNVLSESVNQHSREDASRSKKIEMNIPVYRTKGSQVINELEKDNLKESGKIFEEKVKAVSSIVFEALWFDAEVKKDNFDQIAEHIQEHVKAFAEAGLIDLDAPVPAVQAIFENAREQATNEQVLFVEHDEIALALGESIASTVKSKVKDIVTKEKEIAEENRADIEEIQAAGQDMGDTELPVTESAEINFLRSRQSKKLQETQTIYRCATQHFSKAMRENAEADMNQVMANTMVVVTMLETFNTMGIMSMTPKQYDEFKQRLVMS